MVGISLFIDIAVSGRKEGSMGSFVCFGIVETTCNRDFWVSLLCERGSLLSTTPVFLTEAGV